MSRTGYSGDLGYELWIDSVDALKVWDTLWESVEGYGVLPFGLDALSMLRIEAGLLLLDVDFSSSRFAWTDEDRSTPIELGFSWMFADLATDDRAFIGRRAIEREIADKTSRWRLTGMLVDYEDYERTYNEAGLIAAQGPHAHRRGVLRLRRRRDSRSGYATSYMYSPILQRHIALVRVRPELAAPGTEIRLEVDVNHKYEYVRARTARNPLYHPARKTA